ncbi:50S ribosomal protein L21 [Candidatus Microgenomates bacterium]|nr:50S ribosomal protein L21 [Candidatus Microgenomates bacterium]
MASFAIVQIGSRQYKAQVGDELIVDRLSQTNGKINLDKVVLLSEDGKVKVGEPYVKDAQVVAQVLGEEKGEKIEVMKYRAKSRYRGHTGFRPKFTKIKVESIGVEKSASIKSGSASKSARKTTQKRS